MSIIEVIPIPPDSGGADVQTGGRYTLRFRVWMDGVYGDHTLATTATDGTTAIPAYGDAHPTDTTARVVEKNAVPDDESPDWWLVTVIYKVPKVDPNPMESPDAPSSGANASATQEPIPNTKQSFKFYRKQVAAEVDWQGLDIINTAGDPYDPPAQKEEFYAEFTLTRTQKTFSVQWALDYMNARNDAEFQFAGIKWQKSALCVIDITESWPTGSLATGGVGHEITIVIRADNLTLHDLKLLDAGYRELVGGNPKQIVDPSGVPVTQPRRLNGSGVQLAAAAASVFNTFRMGPREDFKKLYLSWSS